jgi:hypothetical protein
MALKVMALKVMALKVMALKVMALKVMALKVMTTEARSPRLAIGMFKHSVGAAASSEPMMRHYSATRTAGTYRCRVCARDPSRRRDGRHVPSHRARQAGRGTG